MMVSLFRGNAYLIGEGEALSSNPTLTVALLEGTKDPFLDNWDSYVAGNSVGGMPVFVGQFPDKALEEFYDSPLHVITESEGDYYVLTHMWSLLGVEDRFVFHDQVVYSKGDSTVNNRALGLHMLPLIEQPGVDKVNYEELLGLPPRKRFKTYRSRRE